MATSLVSTGVQFPDTTIQTTAATAGFSGATTVSSAVDITLTSASTQTQIVTMTASGKSVILPNATTLTKGGVIYNIINSSSFDFYVKTSSGLILDNVPSGQSAILFLATNSTADGTWQISVSATPILNYANYSSVNTSSTAFSSLRTGGWGFRGFAVLSSTLVVYYYIDSSKIGYCVAGSISSGVITFGTPVQISATALAENGSTFGAITRVNATTALVMATITTTSYVAMTVSGNTITMGTVTSVDAGSNTTSWLLNPTDNLVIGCFSPTGSVKIRAATVSGTTITLGTAVALTATSYSYGAGVIDSARIILEDSGKARVASISGTTITLGTASATSLTATGSSFYLYQPVSNTNCYLGQSLVTYGSTGTTISAVTASSYTSYSSFGAGAGYGIAVSAVTVGSYNWLSNWYGDVQRFTATSSSITNGLIAANGLFSRSSAYNQSGPMQAIQYFDASNVMVCGFNSTGYISFGIVKVA